MHWYARYTTKNSRMLRVRPIRRRYFNARSNFCRVQTPIPRARPRSALRSRADRNNRSYVLPRSKRLSWLKRCMAKRCLVGHACSPAILASSALLKAQALVIAGRCRANWLEEDGGICLCLPVAEPVERRRNHTSFPAIIEETLLARITVGFALLHQPPNNFGINRTTWKMADLSRVMKDAGQPAGEDVIRKIVKSAGYRWRKARVVLTSRDLSFPKSFNTSNRYSLD